jgi:hypothetical protein
VINKGDFKAGDSVPYSFQFHDDDGITEDITNPAGTRRKPDNTFVELAGAEVPAKLDGKTGWYGASIDTTAFAVGVHEVRVVGTVDAHEVGTVFSFKIVAYNHADIIAALDEVMGSGFVENTHSLTDVIDLIANLYNLSAADVLAQVSAGLAAYDPPTRAEMDAGHQIIVDDLDDVKGSGFVPDEDSLTNLVPQTPTNLRVEGSTIIEVGDA